MEGIPAAKASLWLGLSAGKSRGGFLKAVRFSTERTQRDTGKKSGAIPKRTYTQGIIGHPTLLQHCLKLR